MRMSMLTTPDAFLDSILILINVYIFNWLIVALACGEMMSYIRLYMYLRDDKPVSGAVAACCFTTCLSVPNFPQKTSASNKYASIVNVDTCKAFEVFSTVCWTNINDKYNN